MSVLTATTVVQVDEEANKLTVLTDGATEFGQVTTFTVSVDGGSNLSLSWDLGDGTSGTTLGDTELEIVHIYESVGKYKAMFTATNAVMTLTKNLDVYVDVPVGVPLLDESFEGVIPSSDWTTYSSLVGGPQWQQTDTRRHSGGFSIFHNDLHGEQDSWLVSPRLLPAADSQLIFWQSENYSWVHYYHGIWVSTGSSDPKDNEFVEWMVLPPGAEDTWEQVALDLGEFAGQPIFIAFRYQGDYADEWYIDDIRVTAPLMSVSNDTVVMGESSVFTASVRNGTNISYTWDFGDGTAPIISTTNVISYTYSRPGDFTVTVTAFNSINNVQATCVAGVRSVMYFPIVFWSSKTDDYSAQR